MTLRLATAIERRRRIRRSVEFLQTQLATQPDAWPDVRTLADVACFSPYHYLRLYEHAVGETPQATVRRLKLQAARQALQAGKRYNVTFSAPHGADYWAIPAQRGNVYTAYREDKLRTLDRAAYSRNTGSSWTDWPVGWSSGYDRSWSLPVLLNLV